MRSILGPLFFWSLLVCAYCAAFQSCTTVPVPPAAPVRYTSKFTPSDQSALVAAIQASTLMAGTAPSDLLAWGCKATEDRTQCYLSIFSALAGFESDYNPNEKYVEKFPDDADNLQISAGLLQLSFDDAKNNGCAFKTAADVYVSPLNLACGVLIAQKWVKKDGVIYGEYACKDDDGKPTTCYLGMGRYWGTMRRVAMRTSMQAAVKAAAP